MELSNEQCRGCGYPFHRDDDGDLLQVFDVGTDREEHLDVIACEHCDGHFCTEALDGESCGSSYEHDSICRQCIRDQMEEFDRDYDAYLDHVSKNAIQCRGDHCPEYMVPGDPQDPRMAWVDGYCRDCVPIDLLGS